MNSRPPQGDLSAVTDGTIFILRRTETLDHPASAADRAPQVAYALGMVKRFLARAIGGGPIVGNR